MLEATVRNLRDEFQGAVEHRREYLAAEPDIINGYCGPYFRGTGYGESDPINHAYEVVALFSGQVVAQIPRCRSTCHAGPDAEIQAKANQDGVNRWIRKAGFKDVMRDLVPEFCFTWAVSVVSMEPIPGTEEFDDPPMWPNLQPVPKDRFFWDPLALTWSSCRFMGHQCVADIADLIAIAKADPESGWNLELLLSLQGDQGTDELNRRDVPGTPTRNEIVWYEAWLPEITLPGAEKDNTAHGSVYTIPVASAGVGDTEEEAWLRKPRPFYGPRWGPYTVFRAHKVPGHLAALGPVTATMPQSTEVNLHAVALARSSRRKKAITVFDGLTPVDEKALMSAEDRDVLRIPGFDKDKMLPVQMGGPTVEQIALFQHFVAQLQRASGMFNAQVGTVTGDATATENGIAADASGSRTADLADRFLDGANQVIKTVSWYIYNTPECVYRLEDGSLYMGGHDMIRSIEVATKAGLIPLEQAATLIVLAHAMPQPEKMAWEELDVEIEQWSMQRTSEAVQQRRLTEGSAAIMSALPLMMQFPWFNWKRWLDQLGESLNWPGLGELVNFEQMQQMAMMQMMAQAQAAAPQPGSGGPATSQAPAGERPPPKGPQRMEPASATSKGRSEGSKMAARSRQRGAQPAGAAA